MCKMSQGFGRVVAAGSLFPDVRGLDIGLFDAHGHKLALAPSLFSSSSSFLEEVSVLQPFLLPFPFLSFPCGGSPFSQLELIPFPTFDPRDSDAHFTFPAHLLLA